MDKSISLFLKYGNRIVQLPVNPEAISVSIPGSNKGTTVVKLGEITNIGLVGLSSLTIDSFFPSYAYPFVNTAGDFKEPQFYIDFIKEIRNDRKPVRLIITGTEINMLVTIEDFGYDRRWGTDDLDYSLKVKEYKEHTVRMLSSLNGGYSTDSSGNVNPVSITNSNSDRPVEKVTPKTYTVISGDSLWKIAQQQLGNGSRWTEIYKLNVNIIKNPSLIYPGQVFVLP